MDHDIDTLEGPVQTVAVAHVAEEEAQAHILEPLRHLRLLHFVAAEHDELPGVPVFQRDLGELLAERAGAAGDQYGLAFEAVGGRGGGLERPAVGSGAGAAGISQGCVATSCGCVG